MRDDLISRRATIDGIDGYFDFIIRLRKQRHTKMQEAIHLDVKSIIDDLPSIQPKTGRWIPIKPLLTAARCSECKSAFADRTNYCPNCGAEMEENENE